MNEKLITTSDKIKDYDRILKILGSKIEGNKILIEIAGRGGNKKEIHTFEREIKTFKRGVKNILYYKRLL